MTVTVTREHEVRAFIEHENERQLEITVEDLIRRLRKQVTPHLELRHMVFVGHEYSHKIRKGRYGNMWYRVFGYRIGWSAWSTLGSCHQVKITSGIANVPSRVEGWRYWETGHPFFKKRRKSKEKKKDDKRTKPLVPGRRQDDEDRRRHHE
ncbi:hypothetical protein [Sinosporangium album]|nr:hypothetical protein [Sinosporangium album]